MLLFSSRRRHTRYWRDWSSDVCSSDLAEARPVPAGRLAERVHRGGGARLRARLGQGRLVGGIAAGVRVALRRAVGVVLRSEERRGGKEGRSRWSPHHLKKIQKSNSNGL